MERKDAGPSVESFRALGRDLFRETIRKGFFHSLAAVLLFSLAAVATCRIVFGSPGEGTFLRGVGKTGIFTLYLLGGFLAGSLHGAASAVLGRSDEIRIGVSSFLDTELLGKISGESAAESLHALRLHLKDRLGKSASLRLLRVLPVAGTLIRSLETLGTSEGEIRETTGRLSEALAGSVADDLRRHGPRARNFAVLLAGILLSIPVLLVLFRR
jgi:hypothetical protein